MQQTLEPEIIEPKAEDTKSFSLERFHPGKEELLSLAKDYGALVIKDVNDIEGVEKVSTARKDLKKKRVEFGKIEKELTEDAKAFIKRVKGVKTELVNIIEPVETKLQESEDAYKELRRIEDRKLLFPAWKEKFAEFKVELTEEEVCNSLDEELEMKLAQLRHKRDEEARAKLAEEQKKLDEEKRKLEEEKQKLEKAKEEAAQAKVREQAEEKLKLVREKAQAEAELEKERAKAEDLQRQLDEARNPPKKEVEVVEEVKETLIETPEVRTVTVKIEADTSPQQSREAMLNPGKVYVPSGEGQELKAEEPEADKGERFKAFLAQHNYVEDGTFFINEEAGILVLYKKIGEYNPEG